MYSPKRTALSRKARCEGAFEAHAHFFGAGRCSGAAHDRVRHGLAAGTGIRCTANVTPRSPVAVRRAEIGFDFARVK